MIEGIEGRSPSEALAHWESDHLRRVARVRSFLAHVTEQFDAYATTNEDTDLAMLTVVMRRLRSLIL